MSDFLDNYLDVLAGLGDGLWWLWLFLGVLFAVLLAYNGCVAALDHLDRVLEHWHESRGHVRTVAENGREQWVPLHHESRTAAQLDEIRTLPEVRRG